MYNSLLATVSNKDYLNASKQLFSSAYFEGGWEGDMILFVDKDVEDADLETFVSKGIIVCRDFCPFEEDYIFNIIIRYVRWICPGRVGHRCADGRRRG